MSQALTKVAAVVVHYKSPTTMRRTLENLSLRLKRHQIIVVDNSSSLTGESLDHLAIILSDGHNRGYAGGVNHGVRYLISEMPAVTEILVCTHEAIFRTNSLDHLLTTAAEHPGGHLVGPQLVTQDTSAGEIVWSNGGSLPLPYFYPTHDTSSNASGVRPVDWVDGAAFIMDVTSWTAIGGIPEEFFMYMEDVAVGLRCRKLGIPVLVNLNAVVEQTANGPSRSLAIRNRMLLAWRYMNLRMRLTVIAEVRLRQCMMSSHPSRIMRQKAAESRAAVREAREIAQGLHAAERNHDESSPAPLG